MKTCINATANSATRLVAQWCQAIALGVPPLAGACPVLERYDSGETVNPPRAPIKNPVRWMEQAANEECPDDPRMQYAASNHLHFGRVWLVNNPCRSGTNLVYEVFENYSDRGGRGNFCAIGAVAASTVTQLAASAKGYVRIETYGHWSAFEGTVTRYELRPGGVVQLGKHQRVVQKPDRLGRAQVR